MWETNLFITSLPSSSIFFFLSLLLFSLLLRLFCLCSLLSLIQETCEETSLITHIVLRFSFSLLHKSYLLLFSLLFSPSPIPSLLPLCSLSCCPEKCCEETTVITHSVFSFSSLFFPFSSSKSLFLPLRSSSSIFFLSLVLTFPSSLFLPFSRDLQLILSSFSSPPPLYSMLSSVDFVTLLLLSILSILFSPFLSSPFLSFSFFQWF